MQNIKNSTQQSSLFTRLLIAAGVIGPLLFIVAFLIEGATRPGYNPVQTQVSYLALSNQGWEQIANFLVSGLLCIAFAVGLRRIWSSGRASVWGPILIGLFELGLIIAGVFVADPGDGYPLGAPLNGSPLTLHGWVHGINGLLLFNVVLPIACFVLARRFAANPQSRRWATYSRLIAVLILVLSILATIGMPFAYRAGFPVVDGLIQRVLILMGWGWISLTAWRLLREANRATSDEAATHIADADTYNNKIAAI